jgi:hypothetical protein
MALSPSRPSSNTATSVEDHQVNGAVDRPATARAVAYCAVGALGALGVLALFLLARPYSGILHDSRLYIGYALAALHPGHLGQDMVLAEDGQSGFTVFPGLLVLVVETFGSSLGAKIVTLAALVLWFGAAAMLMACLAQGRTRWVMLIFVAVLPAHYAAYEVFSYAEPLAVPRPFAEAFVLLALALMASGRKAAALVPLAIAVLFHPIIALPGLAVWYWLTFFDPQERVARPVVGVVLGLIALAVLMLAALLGVAVAARLFTVVDPTWRDILMTRSPYLFVSAWPLADWSRLIVQAVTVAIAASLVTGRARSLFIAVAAIALGGVLFSLLFGDVLGSLLVVQVQPWRATWLLAVFAAAGLGLCAIGLWRQGAAARVALAILVLAWIESDVPLPALLAAGLALVLTFVPLRSETDIRRLSLIAWGVVAFCAVLYLGMHLYAFALLVFNLPGGGALELAGHLNLFAIPVCGLAVLWANARPDPRIFAAAAGVSLALAFAAILVWDDRTEWHAATDRFGPDPALADIIAARDGEMLWIGGGFATWSQAARPNWVSRLQGASNVFSRPLALVWDDRSRRLADLGLVDRRLRTPFGGTERTSNEEPSLRNLSDASLEQLCAAEDAPAWVVVPARAVEDGQVSAARWTPSHWTAPGRNPSFAWDGESVTWTETQDYVVLACGP